MKQTSKFGRGDVVKIVNYGGLIWIKKEEYKLYQIADNKPIDTRPDESLIYRETEKVFVFDMNKNMIGKLGIINKVEFVQGKHIYSINRYKDNNDYFKTAWYFDDQLELAFPEDKTRGYYVRK